ncbi:hypothetical protein V8J36_09345 [Frigidibacter sp. MR17.14]|uniref:hypothetical protein n=1 Tax=Frigidibacter sp. MR17.14 TaxID=3126509 RepID=UPI003012D8E9
MHISASAAVALLISLAAATTASAACDGGLGRGWASGKGDGKFTMVAADKSCPISYPAFIYDTRKVPATEMKLTRAPKSGKLSLSASGPVYTPNAGFKGADKFCIRNTAKGEKGSLSGCVTVTVN